MFEKWKPWLMLQQKRVDKHQLQISHVRNVASAAFQFVRLYYPSENAVTAELKMRLVSVKFAELYLMNWVGREASVMGVCRDKE